jgi:hypothetical protein
LLKTVPISALRVPFDKLRDRLRDLVINPDSVLRPQVVTFVQFFSSSRAKSLCVLWETFVPFVSQNNYPVVL